MLFSFIVHRSCAQDIIRLERSTGQEFTLIWEICNKNHVGRGKQAKGIMRAPGLLPVPAPAENHQNNTHHTVKTMLCPTAICITRSQQCTIALGPPWVCAIVMNCWGSHLDNTENIIELFYEQSENFQRAIRTLLLYSLLFAVLRRRNAKFQPRPGKMILNIVPVGIVGVHTGPR